MAADRVPVLRGAASVLRALVRPDRAFRGGGVLAVRPVAVAAALFVLCVIGQRLVAGYDQNPDLQVLAIAEVESRIGSLMSSAPPEAQAQARAQMAQMLTGGRGSVFTSVSVVTSGLWFLVIALEQWLVLSVLAQFAGGEEERAPDGRRRASMLLLMVASVPLALRKLVEGIVMSLKDPAVAANALTLSDYRAFSKVRFDLYGLLRLPDLPAFPGYLVRRATDPFSLWCLCILVVGGVAVYRMPIRKTLLQSALLLVVLAAQTALFAAIGIPWEM